MKIIKAELRQNIIDQLIALSICWEQEDSCYGYRRNSIDDFKDEDIFVAEENGQIIGYLLSHIYMQGKESITVPCGSKCLEIEELYVLHKCRSKGIGKSLFQYAVSHYDDTVEYVTLSTATKNYKAILHFYIEELGMNFWSARIFKKL